MRINVFSNNKYKSPITQFFSKKKTYCVQHPFHLMVNLHASLTHITWDGRKRYLVHLMRFAHSIGFWFKRHFVHVCGWFQVFFFFFFLREFQSMASTPDDSSFITRPRHQSVFGVGKDWTLDLLYNYQRFYQLSWLAPMSFFFFFLIV